jgi:hypothetical protein
MKTLKDLNKKLTLKNAGYNYTYKIENTIFEINEFNSQKGWCLNEKLGGFLVDSYGYEGLTLSECKEMILMSWNSNSIK